MLWMLYHNTNRETLLGCSASSIKSVSLYINICCNVPVLSATINVSLTFGSECPTLPEHILIPETILLHIG